MKPFGLYVGQHTGHTGSSATRVGISIQTVRAAVLGLGRGHCPGWSVQHFNRGIHFLAGSSPTGPCPVEQGMGCASDWQNSLADLAACPAAALTCCR